MASSAFSTLAGRALAVALGYEICELTKEHHEQTQK
jgi:hypothetical protein